MTQPSFDLETGEAYEFYVGRWSRDIAHEFFNWLDVSANARWLDVGCGTGAMSAIILRRFAPAEVKGVDGFPDFLNYARETIVDERVSFEFCDAQSLPVADGTYDAVVAGLVLNFVADPLKCLREMTRAAKPGGVVAAYVWDYADKMQMMRYFWDAVIALHPDARPLDEGQRFPLCAPEPLMALFTDGGLGQVDVRAIDVPTPFRDFDDFWFPFLGGVGPAGKYVLTLSEPERAALRDHLQVQLPINADGSIDLIARAWAVRGTRAAA